jgi:hypothetical protein
MAVSLNCGLTVDSSKVSDILQETKCLYSLLAVTFKHGPGKSLLCFSIQPFKCQVSAVAGALSNLNTHCSMVFSLSGKNDVHLMGKRTLAH